MVTKISDRLQLSETGWGIIFPADVSPAIKEAFAPLLRLRQAQAGPYFKVFEGDDGYQAGETKSAFLNRHGSGGGRIDPQWGLPYYLLMVGSPDEIPYPFQHQLAIQYALGRLHFDHLEDYARYAQNVVAVEQGQANRPRQISLFSPTLADHSLTQLATTQLIDPLYQALKTSVVDHDYELNRFTGEQATKSQLKQLLGGAQTPALLFTAGRGAVLPSGDPQQMTQQGALLCQEEAGSESGSIFSQHYFSGDDLDQATNLLGLLTFHLADCSAGTPLQDESTPERNTLAPQPFIAYLAKQLLSHPQGGALAVVGNVGPIWGYSFSGLGVESRITVFESMVERLLKGYPLGGALKYFGQLFAEIGADLHMLRQEVRFGATHDPAELSQLTKAYHETGGWTIIGDPAVRLST